MCVQDSARDKQLSPVSDLPVISNGILHVLQALPASPLPSLECDFFAVMRKEDAAHKEMGIKPGRAEGHG